MRSGAQIISYELSCGLSILTMVVLMGTMQFSEIVEGQADGWFIFKGHIPALIAFIIYLIAGNAETNRGPFDLPEAESELTAESVYRSLRGSHHLPGRLDAATHRRPGRLQRSDGLHSGICMVLRKGLLRSLPADVDKVDLPPPAY